MRMRTHRSFGREEGSVKYTLRAEYPKRGIGVSKGERARCPDEAGEREEGRREGCTLLM